MHQEVTKASSLWITMIKKILIWFHLSTALPQSSAHYITESVCRFPAPILKTLIKWYKGHWLPPKLDGYEPDCKGHCRESSKQRTWEGPLTTTSTCGAGWLLCVPRAHRWSLVPKCWKYPKRKCGLCTFKRDSCTGDTDRAAPQPLPQPGQMC